MSANTIQIESVFHSLNSYTSAEQAQLNNTPAEKRPLLEASLKLQKEQETVSFISNLLKQMHDNRMAIINNMH